MPCVFCILWDFLVLDDELVALEVVVKAHFLISSEITVCTLVLLLKHVVWVVLHVPLQEPTRLEFLATDVARIDRQWQAVRADYYGCNREDDLLKCAHLNVVSIACSLIPACFVIPVWHCRVSPFFFFLILCFRVRLALIPSLICRYGVVVPCLLSK